MPEIPDIYYQEIQQQLKKSMNLLKLTRDFGDNGMVIVHQSGLSKSPVGEAMVKLSWDARMRNMAALYFLKNLENLGGVKPRALILGGGMVYQDFPRLGDLAIDFLQRKGLDPEIPTRVTDSRNTVEDLDRAYAILKKEDINKGVVISNQHHLTARVYLDQLRLLGMLDKIDLMFLSAEDILIDHYFAAGNFLGRKVVKDVQNSSMVAKIKRKQAILGALLMTPGGRYTYQFLANQSVSRRAVAKDYQPDFLYNQINGVSRPLS